MKHNIDVVVGLQFGSEAKGKIVEYIAPDYDIMVRTGAPNAGHTAYYGDIPVAFQQIPCGAIANEDAILVIGAGGLILKSVLKKEMEKLNECGAWGNRLLIIDEQAALIDDNHIRQERGGADPCTYIHNPMSCPTWKALNTDGKDCEACEMIADGDLWKKIGSTREGCGAALAARIWRKGDITLVKDDKELMDWASDGTIEVRDTALFLNDEAEAGAKILLEGTQGAGLSMFHGYYPYTTSRDTNVSNWLAEAGLSPMVVRNIIGVMRTFPIRVAGNSGPVDAKELSWNDIEAFSGAPDGSICEKTTVTKRIRRVFEFNYNDVEKAILINRPTHFALMFMDYVDYHSAGVNCIEGLSEKCINYMEHLKINLPFVKEIGIQFISTGPHPNALIDCGWKKELD